jgi:hypothetical protein
VMIMVVMIMVVIEVLLWSYPGMLVRVLVLVSGWTLLQDESAHGSLSLVQSVEEATFYPDRAGQAVPRQGRPLQAGRPRGASTGVEAGRQDQSENHAIS